MDLIDSVDTLVKLAHQHTQILASYLHWSGTDGELRRLLRRDPEHLPLRPYLDAIEAVEAQLAYLLIGRSIGAEALEAAERAAQEAAYEAKDRVYKAALEAGLAAAAKEAE